MEDQERGVNEVLRAIHLEQLKHDDNAVRLYDQLCTVIAQRPDGIDDAAQHIVSQIAELEILRNLAREDILDHGVTKDFYNGKQHIRVENKSIGTLHRTIEAQRKLMNELQITPASRKGMMQLGMFGDDGFDSF